MRESWKMSVAKVDIDVMNLPPKTKIIIIIIKIKN